MPHVMVTLPILDNYNVTKDDEVPTSAPNVQVEVDLAALVERRLGGAHHDNRDDRRRRR